MVRARLIAVALLALVAGALAVGAGAAGGQDGEESLRGTIEQKKGHERALAGAVARLARLERATAREVGVLERRVAAARGELAAAEAVLADTEARLEHQRKRALRLRERLSHARAKLAKLLRERYAGGKPDIVTVILHADGFAQLQETVDFLKRIQRQDEQTVATVRGARRDALGQRRQLTKLAAERRTAAEVVRRRHAALQSMAGALRARRSALATARVARAAALRGTRASRRRAERALQRLLAQRARALAAAGPGGPWAIPWPIVQCESGGQNLPPNSAGASGYYQFLPETWRGMGGSTPEAHQASKAEQDRLAAALWDGGRGAHNWVCAALVAGG